MADSLGMMNARRGNRSHNFSCTLSIHQDRGTLYNGVDTVRAEVEPERLLVQIQEHARQVQQIMDTVPERLAAQTSEQGATGPGGDAGAGRMTNDE